MSEQQLTVKVLAPKNELPPKAGMYAGQVGKVLEISRLEETYYRVEFDNGDVAAYLEHEIEVIQVDYWYNKQAGSA